MTTKKSASKMKVAKPKEPELQKPSKQEMWDGVTKDGKEIPAIMSKKYFLDKVDMDIKLAKTVDKFVATKNIIKMITDLEVVDYQVVLKYQMYAVTELKKIKKYLKDLDVKTLEELKEPPFSLGDTDITTLSETKFRDTAIKEIIKAGVAAPYNKDLASIQKAILNCEN